MDNNKIKINSRFSPPVRGKGWVIFLLPFLFLLITSSCTSYKDIAYLQDLKVNDTSSFYPYSIPEYKIQKGDILYINILSLNREASSIMNMSSDENPNQFTNEMGMLIYGYNVNDSGNIELPVIGEVKVANLSVPEIKEVIEKEALVYLKNPTITVKLLSFRYSVLGEVANPGNYQSIKTQVNILEAISKAGDITPYGNRTEILVLRPTENGTKAIIVDLTSKHLLQNDAFFLLPNDVIYVKPLKTKAFRNNIPTISVTFGAISTLFLVLRYFQ